MNPSSPPAPIELRVHGVSGTSPESLLDRPLVQQVAGDAIAGFYRPRLLEERKDDAQNALAPHRPDAPKLEGYNWGGLTSGSPGRAFWLLLLPFTLVNIAPRARPPGRDNGRLTKYTTWTIWYFSRALALGLTALFVLTAAGVGEDLIGWQCIGASDRCAKAAPGWVFGKLLGRWQDGVRISGISPEHMLALGTLVPTALLLLLWLASKRTVDRYEQTAPHGAAATRADAVIEEDTEADAIEVGLGSPRMWRNAAQVRRLRGLHLQFGFAVILWTVLMPSLRLPAGELSAGDVISIPFRDWHNVALLVPIAVAVFSVIVLAIPSYTGRNPSKLWQRISALVWLLLAAASVADVLGLEFDGQWLSHNYLSADQRLPVGGLPGFADTFIWLFLAIVVVLIKLTGMVVVAVARRDRSDPQQPHRPLRPGLYGNVATVFATMGVFFAAVFSAGGYTFAAAWLHTGSLKPGFGEVSYIYRTFDIPEIARDATLAYSYAVGFFLIVMVVVIARTVWALQPFPGQHTIRALVPEGAMEHDYGDQADSDPARAKQIQRDIFFGRIPDRVPIDVAWLIVAGSVITLAFGLLLLLEHTTSTAWVDSIIKEITPAEMVSRPPGFFSPVSLEGTGAYLAVITLVGLVALALAAFRVPATRRSVGILWDVASFWPRSVHPLAAPCYAERAVPDLVTRISWMRSGENPPPLVLAAHSQGTVISAAVIFQLYTYDRRQDGPVLRGLSFLSFGCVLRRLYGRYFPVYFGPNRLADLQTILTRADPPGAAAQPPRWRNLWRYTDYLGGQVTAGPAPLVPPGNAPPPDPTVLLTEPPIRGPVDWEWHSPDPPRFERPPGWTTFARTKRHSDFWSDESGYYQLAVDDLS